MAENENVCNSDGTEKESFEYGRYTFSKEKIIAGKDENSSDYAEELDEDVKSHSRADTEYESDRGYREITESIIEISKNYLDSQNESKKPLRKNFFKLFAILLSAQYIFLVLFIMFNSFTEFPFCISEEILRLYIISVFAETLSAMAVMITFAFVSTDETKIVGVLNSIVENYQKVNLNNIDDTCVRADKAEKKKANTSK